MCILIDAVWAGSSMVEHLTLNQLVVGSSPTRLTKHQGRSIIATSFLSLLLSPPQSFGLYAQPTSVVQWAYLGEETQCKPSKPQPKLPPKRRKQQPIFGYGPGFALPLAASWRASPPTRRCAHLVDSYNRATCARFFVALNDCFLRMCVCRNIF